MDAHALDAGDLFASPWRRIVLSEKRDSWCLVDAEDYDWLMAWRWNIGWHRDTPWKFYGKRNVGAERSTIYMHREILIRAEPKQIGLADTHHCDHINGQSLDNRRANLRWLTPKQNSANRRARADIPSLTEILRELMAASPAARTLEDIPF